MTIEQNPIHYNILVEGKVQGVYYRLSAQEKALELGINGFVKNKNSGGVYIEAEGTATQIEAFLLWCHQGPALAKVEKVTYHPGEWVGYGQFSIER
ncbi:acylphosphatase [Xanthovirga aplysinae]|uniref:acylphosphatase n=1 Tax=Xanthovirga aplysinae TaxID=2529853 RepID=UPI0012BBF802|nr:acylphosphatase [Xanthovirga aplysinae]MTI30977.1 acylphosphatase [Xanthovirga aplysinae]